MKRLSMISLLMLSMIVSVPVLAQTSVRYTIVPNFFSFPADGSHHGPSHGGAAVDKAGNYYISTDTEKGILVFGKDGKYKRCFGPSNMHGIFLARERDGEYIYGANPGKHEVIKLKTDGKVSWTMGYPTESGIYTNAGEFNPTNMVSMPDGTIFVADGYGKNYIHKYDKNRKYIKSFGGPGGNPAEDGKFNRCHGLAVDLRGKKPGLIVCNRESGKVESWDADGNLIKVLQRHLRMPAAAHVYGDYVAVAELQGRVTILGKDGSVVAYLGDNPNESQRANYGLDPSMWTTGIINSGHGVVIDHDGNVIVSEWTQFGRIHKFSVSQLTELKTDLINGDAEN